MVIYFILIHFMNLKFTGLASRDWEWRTWRPTYPDDKNPLDEGKAEAADGAVASRDGIGQAEGQAEPDPVEQESHWRDKRSLISCFM